MIDHVLQYVAPAAYSLLPPEMYTPKATALVLAVGLQESKFRYRHQLNGSARGFWQFEIPSVEEVLTNQRTRGSAQNALRVLRYHALIDNAAAIHTVLEHHDTLAFLFARLLFWTFRDALARKNQYDLGYRQYLRAWKPGREHELTWRPYFTEAWDLVVKSRVNGPVLDGETET